MTYNPNDPMRENVATAPSGADEEMLGDLFNSLDRNRQADIEAERSKHLPFGGLTQDEINGLSQPLWNPEAQSGGIISNNVVGEQSGLRLTQQNPESPDNGSDKPSFSIGKEDAKGALTPLLNREAESGVYAGTKQIESTEEILTTESTEAPLSFGSLLQEYGAKRSEGMTKEEHSVFLSRAKEAGYKHGAQGLAVAANRAKELTKLGYDVGEMDGEEIRKTWKSAKDSFNELSPLSRRRAEGRMAELREQNPNRPPEEIIELAITDQKFDDAEEKYSKYSWYNKDETSKATVNRFTGAQEGGPSRREREYNALVSAKTMYDQDEIGTEDFRNMIRKDGSLDLRKYNTAQENIARQKQKAEESRKNQDAAIKRRKAIFGERMNSLDLAMKDFQVKKEAENYIDREYAKLTIQELEENDPQALKAMRAVARAWNMSDIDDDTVDTKGAKVAADYLGSKDAFDMKVIAYLADEK